MFLGTAPIGLGRFAAGQSNPENGPLTAGEGFDLTAYVQRNFAPRSF